MEPLVAELMARLKPVHSAPLYGGVEVSTPRGYGTIVEPWVNHHPIHSAPPSFIIELEDGTRYIEQAIRLQVVERDGG